eukprot:COSAG01_NODE_2415_length_7736_cov_42.301034_6_plen_1217_part_00
MKGQDIVSPTGTSGVALATRSVEDQLAWGEATFSVPTGSDDWQQRRLQAAACVPGQHYDTAAGACVACTAGRAQPAGGRSSCVECSAGKYATGKSLNLSSWTRTRGVCFTCDFCMISTSRVCDTHVIHEDYDTAAEAMAACWNDAACRSVFVKNCDGTGPMGHPWDWSTTTMDSSSPSSLEYNTCLYTPPVNIGSATCAVCPAGTFSGTGAEACTPCAAGYSQPAVGQSHCAECSADSYSPGSVDLSAWTHVPGRNCQDVDQIHGYREATDALSACVLDTACLSVFDHGCDGSDDNVNWKTCRSATGSPGSKCLYTPPPIHRGSVACANCPVGKTQPYGSGGKHAFEAEHADDISDCFFDCAAGTSVNTLNEKGGCAPCPFPERCLGSNCSAALHSTGNLCGSCVQGYYSAGQFCAKCADSPWLTMLAAVIGVAAAALVVWKLSKQEAYKPPSTVDVGKTLGRGVASIAGQAKQTQQAVAMQSPAAAGANSDALASTMMSRSAHTLVASVVWPHFTYSLLPLMLPNMHWPSVVTDTVKWFRSLAFLDIGIFVEPGCFNSGADSANKALTRLGLAHGGFWLVLAGFALVRCAGKCTEQHSKISQRAVNAAVFAFLLAHALLLRSCLAVMHCVESSSNIDHLSPASQHKKPSKFVGHLQSDPDTACDLRTTVLLVSLMMVLLITIFGSKAAVTSLVEYRARRSARRAATVPALAMSVTVPVGVASGQPMLINTMAGQIQVVVPQGLGPGMVFQVPLPAPDQSRLEAQLAKKKAPIVKCICIMSGCTWLYCTWLCGYEILSLLVKPEGSLSAAEHQLPAFGTIGTIVYGFILPLLLHRVIRKNVDDGRLDDPDFRARYGYLINRFKPGKWGSEFRILSRKTVLLLVTIILSEYSFLVAPAQLVTLGWAFYKQWKERPFAEVGSKKQTFEHETPNGWSRGDVLEALSLGSQIAINLIALTRFKGHEVVHAPELSAWTKTRARHCENQIFSYHTATEALDACWVDADCLSVCDDGEGAEPWITCKSANGKEWSSVPEPYMYTPPTWIEPEPEPEILPEDQANDEASIVIALATLMFVLLPAMYGIHIVLTEWRVGRRTKRQTQNDSSTTPGTAINSNRRRTGGLSDSLMGGSEPSVEMIELMSSPLETAHMASAAATLPPSIGIDAMEELLRTARLAQYTEALRELGCVMPEDLEDLQEAEMIGLGMKKIEIRRLLRALRP